MILVLVCRPPVATSTWTRPQEGQAFFQFARMAHADLAGMA